MWTRRISSGSDEHKTPGDVFRALLQKLIQKRTETSWVHFEVISEGGWFSNLLSGNHPWIEVSFIDAHTLGLNPGFHKAMAISVPSRWPDEKKRKWFVPMADLEELMTWMNESFVKASGRPEYRVTGWLEGL